MGKYLYILSYRCFCNGRGICSFCLLHTIVSLRYVNNFRIWYSREKRNSDFYQIRSIRTVRHRTVFVILYQAYL